MAFLCLPDCHLCPIGCHIGFTTVAVNLILPGAALITPAICSIYLACLLHSSFNHSTFIPFFVNSSIHSTRCYLPNPARVSSHTSGLSPSIFWPAAFISWLYLSSLCCHFCILDGSCPVFFRLSPTSTCRLHSPRFLLHFPSCHSMHAAVSFWLSLNACSPFHPGCLSMHDGCLLLAVLPCILAVSLWLSLHAFFLPPLGCLSMNAGCLLMVAS